MPKSYRARKTFEVDLFPFLSILACTIGSLILIIVVLTSQIVGNQKQVTIVAKTENGLNNTKQPLYMECDAEGVIIYPDRIFVPLSSLDFSDSRFQRMLRQINPSREYLIVAVRPNGIDTFKKVRSLIEDKGIDIGYEPLDEGWKLNIKSESKS